MTPQITWAAKTDIGRVRSENQDRWLARPEDGLFAVADGMGGMRGGAEAAATALATLEQEFARNTPATPESWEALVRKVNDRVWQRGLVVSPNGGIGTTLTLLHFTADGVTVVHVGDSACFLVRAGKLTQLTNDHTVAAEAERRIARGLPAEPQPWAEHILTRCIGQPFLDGIDVSAVTVQPGDRFLLCTDGITKVLDDRTIASCLKSPATPDETTNLLIAAALAAGAPDNATGIAVFAGSA
ncbi:MAG TPA: protein phosphatase 2C domain-containing protein [Opitutaceae bacterium]|nr:protein phosphatase 2C domain-containing protein [Opitutaceae bacterium]